MKKLLATLVLIAGFAAMANAEIKLETLNWLDYDQFNYTNVVPLTNQKGGQFAVTRSYVTLQGDIGKDIFGGSWKARVTLDLANVQLNTGATTTKVTTTAFATTNIGLDANTNVVTNIVNGVKTVAAATSSPSVTPMKYAYVDYKVMGWDPLVLTFGLLKTQFGNIGNWEYPLPWKDATEQYGNVTPTASADFGVALSGKALPIEGMTKNLLTYYAQVLNGEGYKQIFGTSDAGVSQFAVMGTLWVTPLDGVSVGGSYRNNSRGSSYDTAYAVMVSVKDVMDIPVDFLAQYIRQDKFNFSDATGICTNTNSGEVISATLGFNVTKFLGVDFGVSPYVRYDIVKENLGTPNNTNAAPSTYQNYQWFYGGVNIQPIKNMQIKPFIAYNLDTSVMEIKCQFEYKCNFSIWQ